MDGGKPKDRANAKTRSRPTAELARAVFSFGSARLASQLGMFVAMVLLARTCGPEAFGAVSFAMAMGMILATPADFGMSAGIQRFVGDLGEAVLRPAFVVKLGVSCAIAAAVLLADRHLDVFRGLGPWIAAIVATSAFPFAIMAENARKHFLSAGLLQLGVTALFLVGALVGAVHWDPVAGPLAARTVSFTLVGAALVPLFLAGGPFLTSGFRQILRMGSQVLANGLLTQVVTRADVILVAYLVGFEATGVYRAALTLGSVPLLLQPLFHAPFMPIIATQLQEGRTEMVRRLHRLSTAALAMVLIPILLGGWVLAAPLLSRFYGDDYADAVWVMRLLLVASSAQVLLAPMGGILYMAGQVKVVTVTTATTALVLFVVALATIPSQGITGAALAACAAQVGWLMLLTALYHHRHPISFSEWKLGRLSVAAAMTLAGALALRGMADDWAGLLGALALICAGYVAALAALGLFAPARVLSLLREPTSPADQLSGGED